jgi:hypothetical protein
MDGRILIGIVLGLVLLAFGGFYFALGPLSEQAAAPAPRPLSPVTAPAEPAAPAPAQPDPAPPPNPASAPNPAPPPPPRITAQSMESEFANSEQAALLGLLKRVFPFEYSDLLAFAVRRRNEGVSDQAFGQELAERFQDILRGKLKYGVAASMATIDKLAANEASLFHALGTEGAAFCLKMLGQDDTPAAASPPDSVRQLMQLGTLYRFQAIAEGMPNEKAPEALTRDEMKAFEASLGREGLNYRDVSTGAYLKGSTEPGKPCLTLETLHLAIARLPEPVRRKIYAGMFFVGRDR